MQQPFGHSITHKTFIRASVDKVYDTITSAKGWDAFFTNGFHIDLRPGGKLAFRWVDWGPDFYNLEAEGTVVKAVRPELFAFQWYPVGRETPTTVEFALEPAFGGSVVKLRECGYPDTREGRAMILECAAGWGEALTLLKFYLEHGIVYSQPTPDM